MTADFAETAGNQSHSVCLDQRHPRNPRSISGSAGARPGATCNFWHEIFEKALDFRAELGYSY
jgi:hypothetical protein